MWTGVNSLLQLLLLELVVLKGSSPSFVLFRMVQQRKVLFNQVFHKFQNLMGHFDFKWAEFTNFRQTYLGPQFKKIWTSGKKL